MNAKIRKIHIIGLNSFDFKELPLSLQNLIKKTANIAVPEPYISEIRKWEDLFTRNQKKNFFKSKSDVNLINWLKESKNDVILLSRGDPLWFGIGRVLIENFRSEELNFYPSNTCLQLALSKLKKPWQNIKSVSIHGRDAKDLIKALKSREFNLAILTDKKEGSVELVQQTLLKLKLNDSYEFWLCENLGLQKERIRKINVAALLPRDISDLNIIILLKKEKHTNNKILPLFGLDDYIFKSFEDRPNLITKREIRVQILADLELPETGTLWDIGAGCGTIGLEALKLRPKLKLYSIDKRFGSKTLIAENAKRLEVFPEKIIEEDINQILGNNKFKNLVTPNRLVIGGCDKNTKIFIIRKFSEILLKGSIIVIQIISFEVLQEIQTTFKELDFNINLNLIQTFKGISIADGTRLEPNNPVFLIKGTKN